MGGSLYDTPAMLCFLQQSFFQFKGLIMKQVHNLSAGTIISDTFCWASIIRPIRTSSKVLIKQLAECISNCRSHVFSLAATLLIGGLFLSGSYLFLLQLAKHGW